MGNLVDVYALGNMAQVVRSQSCGVAGRTLDNLGKRNVASVGEVCESC